jgi:hypothetical protein
MDSSLQINHRQLQSSYSCACNSGYGGTDCAVHHCHSHPCQNGGTCDILGSRRLMDTSLQIYHRQLQSADYTCTCANGYTNENCDGFFCDSNPCQNGASCFNGNYENGYTCICTPGWGDDNCDTNDCDSGPCLNGAACDNDLGPNYECSCAPGYSGHHCNMSYCESAPCLNGAVCVEGRLLHNSCTCTDDYTGKNCETELTELDEYRTLKYIGIGVFFISAIGCAASNFFGVRPPISAGKIVNYAPR